MELGQWARQREESALGRVERRLVAVWLTRGRSYPLLPYGFRRWSCRDGEHL